MTFAFKMKASQGSKGGRQISECGLSITEKVETPVLQYKKKEEEE